MTAFALTEPQRAFAAQVRAEVQRTIIARELYR
jgi:hypothetical protein